ncbi:short-chain dehydrogenase reductase [Botrytis cinerea]
MSFFVLLTSILILLLSIPLFYRTKWWRDGLEQVCFRRIPINALSISSLPSNFSMLLTPVLRISLSRPISTMSFFLNHLKSHTLVTLPIPEKKFTGKTIIVTGSNSGLGLEAARWFVRLDAQKVILAVRSLSKGEAARQSIISSTSCSPDTLEVWNLDLCSQSSVREFAHRANALPRLDVLVSNAGIYVFDFEVAEGNEETICVNVINTFFFVHHLTTFPERRAGNVFEELRVEERADMKDRYNVSKLISLLFSRELAFALRESERRGREGHVVANIVNPGLVDTEIMRHATGATKHLVRGAMKLMARSVEEGSRTLVHAAGGEEETNGMYLDDCKIGKVSPWTTSLDGIATQKDIWMELSQELEKVEPGIMGNV